MHHLFETTKVWVQCFNIYTTLACHTPSYVKWFSDLRIFNLTQRTSLKNLEIHREFKIKFCGLEHWLVGQNGLVITPSGLLSLQVNIPQACVTHFSISSYHDVFKLYFRDQCKEIPPHLDTKLNLYLNKLESSRHCAYLIKHYQSILYLFQMLHQYSFTCFIVCSAVTFIFDSMHLGEFVRAGLVLFMCLCVLLGVNKSNSAEKTCGSSLQNNVLINNVTGSCSALSDEIKDKSWMRCHYQLTTGPLAFNYTTLWVKNWRLWSRCWIKRSVLFWPNMGLFLAS